MPANRSFFVGAACLLAAVVQLAPIARGGETDWPQWRGPNRDGHAAPQSLLQSWPEGGPKLKWQFRNAGEGYSTLAVVDGRLYTMGSRGDQCFVICIDASTGEGIWETPISRASVDQDYAHGWGGGPRSTPTVDGEHVYALSDIGTVGCLKVSDGRLLWSVNLVEEFGGSVPNWGYAESLLIDGDRVVVTPGGENFMVALDKKSGNKVWGSQGIDAPAQYGSVIRHEFEGVPVYLNVSKSGLLGVDPESGAKLFESSVTGNNVAVIPTPIATGDLVYHTSDYGAGNALLRLNKTSDGLATTQVYHLQHKSMQNHHGGVVLVDGVIYGFTKADGGRWMAQDLESGETLWAETLRPNKSGSIAYADGRLYCYNDKDGSLVLVEPSREGWKPVGSLTLPEQTEIARKSGAIWAHPVIADQMVLIRDQDLIFAYDIAR
ncbi:PQQ-binding-like beta-propeller repeat protein [Candidatus Laterigemmans baculatus]|uniref:PQQ-binding-like beta-propeller repeat protein n=1 Tax=Candidatus Laterigemmans baculatus TaxID=2770505 RepID=UPI0013D93356|nr:PQQ-binding-like beta-propeller repeat protein [Candidatus Laterigemmans baculatus]